MTGSGLVPPTAQARDGFVGIHNGKHLFLGRQGGAKGDAVDMVMHQGFRQARRAVKSPAGFGARTRPAPSSDRPSGAIRKARRRGRIGRKASGTKKGLTPSSSARAESPERTRKPTLHARWGGGGPAQSRRDA